MGGGRESEIELIMQIQVHPLFFHPRQKLAVPLGTRFLAVYPDMRNQVGIWTLADTENDEVTVEIVMVRLMHELTPANANYVGNYRDNSGVVFVFVNTDCEQPKPVVVEGKKKRVLAEAGA